MVRECYYIALPTGAAHDTKTLLSKPTVSESDITQRLLPEIMWATSTMDATNVYIHNTTTLC